MRILLITGDEMRHRYFAETLHRNIGLAGVIFEKKANKHKTFDYTDAERTIVERHFASRDASEQAYFGDTQLSVPAGDILHVATGATNEDACFEWICEKQPAIIQLFGSSLIGDRLLEQFKGKVMNVHLGLSPYYRGSGTNFWAMVEGNLACVGATIHLATKKVDAGGILHQVRPSIATGDSPHDLGNKTIIAAVEALPAILHAYENGQLQPLVQDLSQGSVYYRKDLTAESILELYQQFESGLVAKQLADWEHQMAKFPIVELGKASGQVRA